MVSRVASLAQEVSGAGGRFARQAMCRDQTTLHTPTGKGVIGILKKKSRQQMVGRGAPPLAGVVLPCSGTRGHKLGWALQSSSNEDCVGTTALAPSRSEWEMGATEQKLGSAGG